MADDPAVQNPPADPPASPAPPEGYKWADDASGVKVLVPEAKFDTFVQARDAKKKAAQGDMTAVEERLANLEANIRKEAEEKAKAEFEAQLERHKKENNVDEVRTLLEQQHQQQLQNVAKERDSLKAKIVEADIKSAFSKVDGFLKELEEDALILYNSKFEVVDGQVKDKASGSYLLGDDGTKLNVAEHVKQFVKSKPQFIAATHSPGSGATGPKNVEGVSEMSAQAYNEVQEKGGIQARELAKRLVDGKLKIIE